MDFSDIRTIIIGEAGEYGKRLVRYLEIHLSSAVRVYHFTTAEGMVSFKEEAEIYLLDERFFKELSEEKQKFLKQKKLILLTWREEQGSFCKYDNPQKLLDMLSDFTDYNSDLSDLAAELKDTPTKLTIVYSPVYDEYLEQIARSFMSLGDVYMGAEDLGYKGIDSEYGEGGDMGDLCYYIHLREENILDILQDMLIPKEEVQVLHSPDLYFYLRELTKEDYAWFFDKIKKESPYREVFWGAGNCFVANAVSQTAKICAKQQMFSLIPEEDDQKSNQVKEDNGIHKSDRTNGRQSIRNASSVFFDIYDAKSLCDSLVEGGRKGISVQSAFSSEEEVQVKAIYTLKLSVPFFRPIRFQKDTAVKRRVFSGYVKHRRDYDAAGDNSIVYVAENGVVYHKNASCSHICLKITGNAAIQDIVHSSKYAACEKCIHKGSSLSAIFVTAYGDCYHSTLGCSGLKRTIKAVRLKDVGRLRPCSRCASGR